MQTGRNTADVGVLIQTGYVAAGYGAPYFTADTREASQVLKDGGNHVGWTNEMISESILDLPNATVRNQRLAPDGPNFKALVLEGDVAFSRSILLRVATAQKLLDWAKAGLPVVIVGNWSAPSVPGLAKPGENATLKAPGRPAPRAADGPQPADQGPDPDRARRPRRAARRRVPGRAAGDRAPRRAATPTTTSSPTATRRPRRASMPRSR